MAAKATRCPHCQTSFRVTETHLATARGLVRCGACLEIFNAAEHWIETEQSPDSDEQPADAESTAEFNNDDILFDDDNGLPGLQQCDEPYEAHIEELNIDEAPEPPERREGFSASITLSVDAETSAGEVGEGTDATTPVVVADSIPPATDDAFAQLVYQGNRQLRINRQQLGWSLLTVLAALALAAQITMANFDRIAQSVYRPQLSSACNAMNFFAASQPCLLPPPQNLPLIRSRGLNIYSHPKYENSLLIDALIVNQAVFEQPFPVIELEFHDQNDRPIASRRFTPDEYLAGELSGLEFMPSQQTVHINISILDPGETAVNYQMRFHPSRHGS
ncbi:MAG: putative Zn finger-like uncharacterized protein [Bermanella sp.]|jgi:predicted Zn finger-like uncharacterized protein